MRRFFRIDRRRRAPVLLVTLVLSTAGCGPSQRLDLTIKEDPVDISYGEQAAPAPPRRAPDAAVVPGSPGLIAPPPGVWAPPRSSSRPEALDTSQRRDAPSAEKEACPAAAPDADQPAAAPDSVSVNPAAGHYAFRREGAVERAGRVQSLPTDVIRTVEQVTEHTDPTTALPIREFDVVQKDGDATTRTSYRVDLEGLSPGLKITMIETTSSDGTESFVPQPALRIFNLPAQPEPGYTQEQAVDPLTGTTVSLNHKTIGPAVLDVCGTLVGVWRVEIYQSQMQRGLNTTLMTNGYFSVGTQLGGMILHDDLVVQGVVDGEAYRLESVDTISSLQPLPTSP